MNQTKVKRVLLWIRQRLKGYCYESDKGLKSTVMNLTIHVTSNYVNSPFYKTLNFKLNDEKIKFLRDQNKSQNRLNKFCTIVFHVLSINDNTVFRFCRKKCGAYIVSYTSECTWQYRYVHKNSQYFWLSQI